VWAARVLADMKTIIVQVKDDTQTTVMQPVEVRHLSDLGETVKEAVEDFIETNDGVVIPPISIKAVVREDPPDGSAES
jgi:hypothetical protein